jgi:predicted CopG family antitoxin
VPPRGWATVSVREDVRRALEEIASQKGFSSLNDVIAFLLDKYREFTDISVRCDKLLTDISVKLDALLQAGRPESTASSTSKANMEDMTQGKSKPGERRRVITFSLEWASRKGINVEEYMARREREGYLCNETSREVVCVWREDLEQLVVELNSAGAKMGELDRVLSGEKLNAARVAERAGLLWYDSREKRWRAPL